MRWHPKSENLHSRSEMMGARHAQESAAHHLMFHSILFGRQPEEAGIPAVVVSPSHICLGISFDPLDEVLGNTDETRLLVRLTLNPQFTTVTLLTIKSLVGE